MPVSGRLRGARRGELAELQIDDLDGNVLTICRSAFGERIGPTKTGRIRRITLGATAGQLWRDTVAGWRTRADGAPVGLWLFSARADHRIRLATSCLAHWFAGLGAEAGYPQVTLHRLRHTVATALASDGHLLQAQYRLGHKDAATTLRTYSHVMPLADADTAATVDAMYSGSHRRQLHVDEMDSGATTISSKAPGDLRHPSRPAGLLPQFAPLGCGPGIVRIECFRLP